jgi:hypothetical protein
MDFTLKVDGSIFISFFTQYVESSASQVITSDDIVFSIDNEERLRITPDGFYVEGRLVSEDKEIYDQFKSWIEYALKYVKENETRSSE